MHHSQNGTIESAHFYSTFATRKHQISDLCEEIIIIIIIILVIIIIIIISHF